jgi:hypothetical protein
VLSGVSARNNYPDWQNPEDTYYGYYKEAPYNWGRPSCLDYPFPWSGAPTSTGNVYYQNIWGSNPKPTNDYPNGNYPYSYIAAGPIMATGGNEFYGQQTEQPVLCGANGGGGSRANTSYNARDGQNGAMSGSVQINYVNPQIQGFSSVIAVVNMGGRGGDGGDGDSYIGKGGGDGGYGGNAGNITLNLQSGGYNLYSDYYINDYKDTLVKFYRTSDYISGYQNTETTYTSIWAQSIGGNGGSNGGDGRSSHCHK